jgi:hypothetical protein
VADKWTEQILETVRKLDLDIAKLVSRYTGGPWHKDELFMPTEGNLKAMKSSISDLKAKVNALADDFWRAHFTSVLESLEFSIECNTKMPYEFITRISAGFDSLVGEANPATAQERANVLSARLAQLPDLLAAVNTLLTRCSDLGRSQVADLLPPLFGNISKGVAFVQAYAQGSSLAAQAKKHGDHALAAAGKIQESVKSLLLSELEVVDIPFEFSVEKGMQAPLDYVLSWYEEDVEYRRQQFFEMAREIDPDKDAYDLLNHGTPGYSSVESLLEDMKNMMGQLKREALRFIDLPQEHEPCGVGLIPPTWRMVCPTFMQIGGAVCINPDNLAAFTRGMVEETLAHEVYPGHYTSKIKSGLNDLPNTFKLGLFMSRCHQEGIAHRSEYLMIPYYKDPIARLEAAKRGWYCAYRVKAEVDLYYNKKPVQEVIDNYMNHLNCTEYSAQAQTRAHMMRPADGISYYTGMRYIEELYRKSNMDMKEFTNQTFEFGNVALKTLEHILSLSPEKKAQLRAFRPLS